MHKRPNWREKQLLKPPIFFFGSPTYLPILRCELRRSWNEEITDKTTVRAGSSLANWRSKGLPVEEQVSRDETSGEEQRPLRCLSCEDKKAMTSNRLEVNNYPNYLFPRFGGAKAVVHGQAHHFLNGWRFPFPQAGAFLSNNAKTHTI